MPEGDGERTAGTDAGEGPRRAAAGRAGGRRGLPLGAERCAAAEAGAGPAGAAAVGPLVAGEGRGQAGWVAPPPVQGLSPGRDGSTLGAPQARGERRLVPAASPALPASSESGLVSVMGLGGEPGVGSSLADSRSPHSAQGS